MTVIISGSLVIYNQKPEQFIPAIESFLRGSNNGILAIVDNSAVPLANEILTHSRVRYIFNNANLGFGKAHNVGFAAIADTSDFHIVLNPDIYFGQEVIPHLAQTLLIDKTIGAAMPRINYPNGDLQRLCKLFPTPGDLIFRRFIPINAVQDFINHRYELHDLSQDKLVDVPCISGCFLFLRSELFHQVSGFDERYFMYMEDVDLVRRIGAIARIIYDPRVSVIHSYAKGSYKDYKLLRYHLQSAFKYFTKWGWIFDSDRKMRNRDALRRIKL